MAVGKVDEQAPGVDETTQWWRDKARSEMGARYAEHTTDWDSDWHAIAESGAKDIARVVGRFRHGEDMDALEIGCGVGRLTVNLAPLFRTLVAVDIAPDVVAEAERHCKCDNVKFQVINGVELMPDEAGLFDVIFSAETFHHIQPNVFRRYLADSYRLLRADGQIVLHVNVQRRTLQATIGRMVRQVLWLLGVKIWRGWPTDPGFRRQYYSGAQVIAMLRQAGFVNVRNEGPSDQQMWFLAEKTA